VRTLKRWKKRVRRTSTGLRKEMMPRKVVPTREPRRKSECKVKHLLTIRSHITNTTSA
jgi:hypothetical protein